jgi:hypothetical protein
MSGGYYVGFFTSAESLNQGLAGLKRSYVYGEDDVWYLQSPDVCVVRGGVVSTLEKFTRDNFPDADIDSWSVHQREISRLQKKQAVRSELLQRTFAVDAVQCFSRKRKREADDETKDERSDEDEDEEEAEDEVETDLNEAKEQSDFVAALARVWPLLEGSDANARTLPSTLFLLLDNGLVTSDCGSQIPQGPVCYCLTAMNKFISCESEKEYIPVSR